MGDLSAHFSRREFVCKCGGGSGISEAGVSCQIDMGFEYQGDDIYYLYYRQWTTLTGVFDTARYAGAASHGKFGYALRQTLAPAVQTLDEDADGVYVIDGTNVDVEPDTDGLTGFTTALQATSGVSVADDTEIEISIRSGDLPGDDPLTVTYSGEYDHTREGGGLNYGAFDSTVLDENWAGIRSLYGLDDTYLQFDLDLASVLTDQA